MNYDTFTVGTTEYKNSFWNKAMKGHQAPYEVISKGMVSNNMIVLPYDSNRKYMEALKQECIFRNIATSVEATTSDSDIWVSTSDDPAEWMPRDIMKSINDTVANFSRKRIECHRLAIIERLDIDFTSDISFDIEKYLIKVFAKRFGKSEENAFINGSGVQMPTGILHDTDGAETGVTTDTITFDKVMELFFSVASEYRKNGVWVMNDETACTLHKLKDADGNYLWNQNSNTIMGKEVYISNAMPSIGAGDKPIAFGDFSYYWIVNRTPISVRTLQEKYAQYRQVGYIAHEHLDAKLIRNDAVKVLKMD